MLGRMAGVAGMLMLGLAPTGLAASAHVASANPASAHPVGGVGVRPVVSVGAGLRRVPRDLEAPLAKPTAIWALNPDSDTALAAGQTGQVVIGGVNSGQGQQWVAGPGRTIRQADGKKLCLDVQGGKFVAGAKLNVAKCTGARSERFLITTQSVIFFVKPAANTRLCLSFPLGNNWGEVLLARCAAVAAQAWSATNLDGVAAPIATPRGALTTPAGGKAGTDVRAQAEPVPWATSLGQYWYITFDGSLTWNPNVLPVVHPITDGAACLALAGQEKAGTAFVLRPCATAAERFLAIWMNNNVQAIWLMTTPDGRYCMRIAGNSGAGDPVVLGGCVGDNNDLWAAGLNLNTAGSSRYSRLYPGTGNSGDALALTGSGAAQKAVIEAQSYAASELWTQVASSPNSPATLFRSMSDPGACLTVSGGHYAAGTQIVVGGCADAADQLFLRAASGATGTGDYTYDELMPFAAGDFCLTAAGGVAVGHLVRLEPCDQNQDQAWYSSGNFSGWGGSTPSYFAAYPVVAGPLPSPGPLLAISKVTATGAQAVLLPTVKGSPQQMWLQLPGSKTGWALSPVYDSGWCLTAPGTTAGTALVLQACDGSAAQSFTTLGGLNPEYNEYSIDGGCLAAGTASQGTAPAVIEPCATADTAENWWSYPAG
jgi:hypothetical protein